MTGEEHLHARILEQLDLTREVQDEELTQIIYRVLEEAGRQEYLPLDRKTALGRELFNAFRKLDLLEEFLEDEEITEIMINGTQSIFLEKKGRLFQSDKRFLSREKLEDVIQQIVAGSNRLVNEANPIVDARLPDGSRVNVVLAPVALNGPIVTIRKFPREAITMKDLLAWQSVSPEVVGFLARLVRAGYNIFISGGTGSGKTTFLSGQAGISAPGQEDGPGEGAFQRLPQAGSSGRVPGGRRDHRDHDQRHPEHLPGEEGTALPVGQTVPVPGEAGGCDPADRGRIQPAGQ